MKMRRIRKSKFRTDRWRDRRGFLNWLDVRRNEKIAAAIAKREAALKRLSQLSEELGLEL